MLIGSRTGKIWALLTAIVCCLSWCVGARAGPIIPLDKGKWCLWCDRNAKWQHDELHLPDEFALSDLPVNPPTIGWQRLYESGIEVTLPSTVEERLWGKFGKRDYAHNEYYFARDDKQVKNGNYLGVSWWWTTLKAPKNIAGKLAFLKFEGVRQRAEIFLNEQLVGYDLIGETPFSVDVTGKVNPGAKNVLAVRITNPGGRLDWPDTVPIAWGDYRLPGSHGFGGINSGVRLEFKPPVYIESVFVMNRPQRRRITVRSELVNTTDRPMRGRLEVSVTGTDATAAAEITLVQGISVVDLDLHVKGAKLWSIESPNLYTCRTALQCGDWTDQEDATFGFRFLECRGVGIDAKFYWNSKRIVVRSAISWGFWGINGLWPDEAMARREILNAKAIGLNCLNFHRCIGRPLTLELQDRLGLLRYEEPGGGQNILSSDTFAAKYMEHKLLRMVKRDRNHPCLALFCVQNEWDPDLSDPRVEQILRKMHELDPTRPIVMKSGIKVKNQAYFLPYEDVMRKDDGTGYSGWFDRHTVGGPGIYVDGLYEGPDRWSHRSDNLQEIVFWGEMLGVGVPDRLEPVHHFYQKTKRTGYDREDNAEQYAALDAFLDERSFRDAFPTVGDLTRSIGNKSYYFWGRMIENVRISDCNDGMVLNGWESTSIENHSGLVDSHRYMKGDPKLISYYCRPLHLAIKSHHLVIQTGEALTTDLHVVNEVGAEGEAEIVFSVLDADGRTVERLRLAVNLTGGSVFGELLEAGIRTDCYARPGYYTLKAALYQADRMLADGRERIFVVDTRAPDVDARGAIRDQSGVARRFLAEQGIELPEYSDDLGRLDYVVLAGKRNGGSETSKAGTVEPLPEDLLRRANKDGTTLIFWTTGPDMAEELAQAMDKRGLLRYRGRLGNSRASWMGSWCVVRDHPLLKGLPVNAALNWEYQTSGTGGLIVDGEGIEWISAYGIDHNRNVGTSIFIVPCGKGRIVVNCLDDPCRALTRPGRLTRPVARRMLLNAIAYAAGPP